MWSVFVLFVLSVFSGTFQDYLISVKCLFVTNFDFRFFLFDFLSTAIQANVISRETFGNDWIRFTIQIGHMFKHGNLRLKKPLDYLWIPMSDFQCKCPKLKIKHTYLILGKFKTFFPKRKSLSDLIISTLLLINKGTYQKETLQNYRLIADRNSIVIDWGDEWHERIRRFQKRQLKGKCKMELE